MNIRSFHIESLHIGLCPLYHWTLNHCKLGHSTLDNYMLLWTKSVLHQSNSFFKMNQSIWRICYPHHTFTLASSRLCSRVSSHNKIGFIVSIKLHLLEIICSPVPRIFTCTNMLMSIFYVHLPVHDLNDVITFKILTLFSIDDNINHNNKYTTSTLLICPQNYLWAIVLFFIQFKVF